MRSAWACIPSGSAWSFSRLRKPFPKIQFVATTHSPQVLGSAKDARVILLQSGSAQPLMGLYGKDTNTLVTVYQGGEERDSRVQADLSAVEKLIDDDQVDQAQTRIADVERLSGGRSGDCAAADADSFSSAPKDGEAVGGSACAGLPNRRNRPIDGIPARHAPSDLGRLCRQAQCATGLVRGTKSICCFCQRRIVPDEQPTDRALVRNMKIAHFVPRKSKAGQKDPAPWK